MTREGRVRDGLILLVAAATIAAVPGPRLRVEPADVDAHVAIARWIESIARPMVATSGRPILSKGKLADGPRGLWSTAAARPPVGPAVSVFVSLESPTPLLSLASIQDEHPGRGPPLFGDR